MFKRKRVLVTGAAGSIGSEIVRQVAPHHHVYCLDFNETGVFDLIEELQLKGHSVNGRVGDIRNKETVEDVFSDFKPEIVYHAAAYKHVTPMEWTPLEAIQTNAIGTYHLIHASKKYKLDKFVFISTDKAIHSNSIMGATKRLGEIMVKNQGKGFVVVRFGNVLGSRGSVLPLWQDQINRGEDITVTHPEMERFFMTIPEAVNLVIEAGKQGQGGEIFILDMGKPIKIIDLAKRLVGELKGTTDIKLIGIRPGETMNEKLMFDEEEKVAIKNGKFWIIK